jgi:O-antigen/teichoic acid export membrane protein
MDQAIVVLSIHIWSSIFVFMGAFSSKWLFANNEINIEVTKTVIAALFNVIANYFFIPYYGAIGASIVSMFAYFIANILVLALLKKTRIIILEQIKSFVYVIHPLKYYRDCRKAICLFR